MLLVFALSHYIREINYFDCKLMNLLSTPEEQCDCKQLVQVGYDKDEDPARQTHLHILPDNYFIEPAILQLTFSPIVALPPNATECNHQEKDGLANLPWEPPKSYN